MEYVDDPDYRQLRQEFLQAVRQFHALHGHRCDWRQWCEELGIEVAADERNLYASKGESPRILVNDADPSTRQAFSLLHELSHFLFRETDDAFVAVLEDGHPNASREALTEMEERLCNEAAAILLYPDHDVAACLQRNGLMPQAVFDLAARRGGSIWAALARILEIMAYPLWGVVMADRGVGEFTWTTSRYQLGMPVAIEDHHPLCQAWHGPVECQAPLPFKSGKRTWRVRMRADANSRRVVALFAQRFPTLPGSEQPPLLEIP